MIENWFGHQRPFEYEYEYRFTEYEYDEDGDVLMPELFIIADSGSVNGIFGLIGGMSRKLLPRQLVGGPRLRKPMPIPPKAFE